MAEAARRLARRLEISERQARRCAEQARDSGPSQVPRPKARAPPRWLWWKLHGVTVRLHTPRSVRRLCAEAGVEVERLVSPDLSGPLRLPVVRGLATG